MKHEHVGELLVFGSLVCDIVADQMLLRALFHFAQSGLGWLVFNGSFSTNRLYRVVSAQ